MAAMEIGLSMHTALSTPNTVDRLHTPPAAAAQNKFRTHGGQLAIRRHVTACWPSVPWVHCGAVQRSQLAVVAQRQRPARLPAIYSSSPLAMRGAMAHSGPEMSPDTCPSKMADAKNRADGWLGDRQIDGLRFSTSPRHDTTPRGAVSSAVLRA